MTRFSLVPRLWSLSRDLLYLDRWDIGLASRQERAKLRLLRHRLRMGMVLVYGEAVRLREGRAFDSLATEGSGA
jgi:hypothetical protein